MERQGQVEGKITFRGSQVKVGEVLGQRGQHVVHPCGVGGGGGGSGSGRGREWRKGDGHNSIRGE